MDDPVSPSSLDKALLDAAATAATETGDWRKMIELGGEFERRQIFDRAWQLLADGSHLARPTALPRWDGKPVEGTVVIRRRMRHLGAELRCARFIASAAEQQPNLMVATEDRLVPLLQRSFPEAHIVGLDDAAVNTAVAEASYEDLSRLYGDDLEAIEDSFRPLAAAPQSTTNPIGARKIGIAWYSTNKRKLLPDLDDWIRVLKGAAGQFHSLQYDEASAGFEALNAQLGGRLFSSAPVDQIVDVDGFAAQIAALDGVLTISNTTAHMAGSLGVPCVVILDDEDHLTWPSDTDRSPFYPALRTIHANGRSWVGVLALALAELDRLMDSRTRSRLIRGTIVAFHTDDALYTAEADRMLRSVKPYGLDVDVTRIAAGDWLSVVRRKVAVLAERREALTGPMLYVDVDAVFHGDPWPLLQHAEDVSYAVLRDGKARSGTIWLADNGSARAFLEDWQARLDAAPDAWDQHPLNNIANDAATAATPYKWRNLDARLCYIFDRGDVTAGAGLRPVIEHLQASRDLTSPGSPKQRRRQDRIGEIERELGQG